MPTRNTRPRRVEGAAESKSWFQNAAVDLERGEKRVRFPFLGTRIEVLAMFRPLLIEILQVSDSQLTINAF